MGRAALAAIVVLGALLAGCGDSPDPAPEPVVVTPTPTLAPPPPPPPPMGGFSTAGTWPAGYALDAGPSKLPRAGNLTPLPAEIVHLDSDLDGVRIEFAVVRPDTSSQVPVLVTASPYFQALTAANAGTQYLSQQLVAEFVPHGYAVALVAVRGSGGSGGCLDFFGPDEQADLDQVATWLATQPWSTGSLGVIGLSYPGGAAWLLAGTGNPAVKTAVVMSGIADLGSLFVKDGVARNSAALLPAALGPVQVATYGTTQQRVDEDGAACTGLPEGTAAGLAVTAAGDDPTGYLAARDLRPNVLANYHGSVLLVSGLRDSRVPADQAYPFADALQASNLTVKQLLGQWNHAAPDDPAFPTYNRWDPRADRADWAELQLRWFDYWLKAGLDVDIGAPASVQDTSFQWRTEEDWPPRNAVPTDLFPTVDGALGAAPVGEASPIPVGYDSEASDDALSAEGTVPPAQADASCPQCPVFETAPLPGELRYAGEAQVRLRIMPIAAGGQVNAKVFVVDAQGVALEVGHGATDLRFANGGTPPVPGQAIDVTVRMVPNDVVVPAGSTLRLRVAVGGYDEHMPGLLPFPMVLDVGGDASKLTLPIIERDGSTVFVPPRGA